MLTVLKNSIMINLATAFAVGFIVCCMVAS